MKRNTAIKANALVAAAIFAALSAPANAENYVGIRYANLSTEFAAGLQYYGGIEWSTPAAILSVGKQINPNFAIEGRFGLGVGDESVTRRFEVEFEDGSRDDADFLLSGKVKNYVGIHARLGKSISESVYPYVQLGYGRTEYDLGVVVTADGAIPFVDTFDVDSSSTATGLGVNFAFSDRANGNLEYMKYFDNGNVETAGLAFALQFDF